jgi:hypothetical protein
VESSPQPSEPSGQLSNKHTIGMAVVIIGLIIGSAIIMIWIGLRFLVGVRQDQAGGKEGAGQELTIKTPVGSLTVQEEVNQARLGLPIYPGAARAKTLGSATINLELPNDETLSVWAAKYETPDALEQVSKFYHQQLQPGGVWSQLSAREAKSVYEIRQEDEDRIVTIERRGDRTWIQLVRVFHGATGPNGSSWTGPFQAEWLDSMARRRIDSARH